MKLRIINDDSIANNTKIYLIDNDGKKFGPLRCVEKVEIFPIVYTGEIKAKLTFINVEFDIIGGIAPATKASFEYILDKLKEKTAG